MKIKLNPILILLFLFLTHSIFGQEEKILNFHVDILINKDRTINVTEKIKVYATRSQIERGIVRTIPQTRTDKNGKTFRYNIDLESVKHNGQKSNYFEDSSDDFTIKIGDKDILIPTGIHDYEIKYAIKGQIGFFDTYDELYWNATGTEWNFPIEKASVTIILPDSTTAIQSACYTGSSGSTQTNCNSKIVGNQTYFEASNLDNYEGLTVAVGFPKGIVLPPPPPTFLEIYGSAILFGCAFSALLYLLVLNWIKFGRDPQTPTIVTQFYPPESLSPAAVNMIINENYDESSATYSIVNLATKGYIQITDTSEKMFGIFDKKSYELNRIKVSDNEIASEEQSIINTIFNSKGKVSFTGTYDSKIANAYSSHRQNLERQYGALVKDQSNYIKLLPSFLIFIISIFIGIYYFTADVLPIAFISIFAVVGTFFISGFIKVILILFKSKISYGNIFRFVFTLIGIIVVTGAIFLKNEYSLTAVVTIIYIVISLLALVYFQQLIKVPSVEKLRIKSLIEGFKMYISAAETNRLAFLNPPEMTPSHFEMILPYAMALGVDKIWGEKFTTMLNNSSIEYNSTWYVGTRPFDSNSMHNFSNSFTSSASDSSTKPSESSSSSGGGSWSSGSSGGGSSGGGGGGGGGGGW